uniref:G protein-coupled receptor 150 n=2 Tax=Latimeria chalumnae TaxID=7897 RepID=H3AH66_LATCH
MEALIGIDGFTLTNLSASANNWNLSSSANDEGKVSDPPVYNRQIRIISMTVIFVVALVGNVTVLHKICCRRTKRRKIDFLIINLALADLCVAVMTLFSQIIWEVLEDEWMAGEVACRIFKVSQIFGLVASSSIIAIIALERHHVIVNPLDSPLPTKSLTSVAWLAALILSIPQAFVFKTVNLEGKEKCVSIFGDLPKWHLQTYIIYGSVAVFFAPFCILCVAYTRILWTIWRKEQNIETSKPDKRSHQKHCRRTVRVMATNSSIPRAKVKTLKMTLVIIILFIVCGLPYFIIELKFAFGNTSELDEKVIAVMGIFVVSNSAVNPYVYLFFKTNNAYLRKLEKNLCFSCLKDYRDNTFRRDPFPYQGKREQSSTTTSETESTVHSVCFPKPP